MWFFKRFVVVLFVFAECDALALALVWLFTRLKKTDERNIKPITAYLRGSGHAIYSTALPYI